MLNVSLTVAEEYAWEQGCAGKEAFPSENAAIAFRNAMHRGGFRRKERMRQSEWEYLHPYWCRFCEQYHLGHMPTSGL